MIETINKRKKLAVMAEYVVSPPFPREIFIDLTSFCNHACVFCSNSKLKKRHTMKPDMVKRVLQEAYENGTRDAGFYATGESFLVNKLHEYVAEAKKIGYEYLFITTNGALATPERAKPVLDAGLSSIKFSISAGTRESYKRIHGKDDFDKVLRNLKWISEYRKQSGLDYRIYVTMVYTDSTEQEIDLIREVVQPYIDEWDPHLLTNQCGNKFDNNELGKIEELNIRGRSKSNICFQPFKGFTVTPEGYVSACVLDYQKYLIVGDLNKTTLKEIWTNKIYTVFRERHIENNIKGLICYNCINNTDENIIPLMPEYAEAF
ncbi:MAG: radical SAM protein [Candidatus Brocadiaceae bacterium]|nr:radical SAM protein [Candidatus Brocadiaceae bacterium]